MKTVRSSNHRIPASDVSIPESEAWLFRNKKAIDSVRRGLQEVAAGKAKPGRSYARFADDGE
jgi:hypothetical protein